MQESLSEVERLTLIGQILATGVGRFLLHEIESADENYEGGGRQRERSLPAPDPELLAFLKAVNGASPAMIRAKFDLPKTTLYRRLKRLEEQGFVRRTGSTRNVVYEIAA